MDVYDAGNLTRFRSPCRMERKGELDITKLSCRFATTTMCMAIAALLPAASYASKYVATTGGSVTRDEVKEPLLEALRRTRQVIDSSVLQFETHYYSSSPEGDENRDRVLRLEEKIVDPAPQWQDVSDAHARSFAFRT